MKPTRELTPEGKLRWLVGFAGADLDYCSPEEWLALRAAVRRFPGLSFGPTREDDPIAGRMALTAAPEPLSEDALRTLQTDIRQLLHSVAALGEPGGIVRRMTTVRGPLTFWAIPPEGGEERATIFIGGGPIHDAVLLMALLLLNRQQVGRIRRCPEPKCGRLFVRTRKQRYCSRRCVNRANQRAWRNGIKGREREAARKRLRYARRRKKALGRKVRVGRKGGTR